LAAPTGKAAARLNASIANAVQQLALDALPNAQEVRHAIPTEVSTVHRLLGSMGGSRRFRHDARNPLPLDVLVLDESSMVDLETMAAVLAALPSQARLVLLGDKDQLASVEAGSVLGELCRRADGGHYLQSTRDWLQAVCGERIPDDYMDPAGQPLDQSVVKLRRSYRFGAHSGIGQLADAVNKGDARRVQKIRAAGRSDLAWVELAGGDTALRRLVLDGAGGGSRQLDLLAGGAGPVGYRHYLELMARQRPAAGAGREAYDAWAAAVLQAYGEFQLLCAVRKGPYGVERLNQRIASLLQAEGLVASAQGWYLGRPVMVTRNDYTTGLMNGDVGVTLELPTQGVTDAAPQTLWRVAFRDSEGGIRWVLPSRLQHVETVYAMTVHKSQGSEFAHTALVLPDRASRVLTRELVYTAVTRAREWFTVAGPLSAGLLENAVNSPTVRASGLLL
jgi:exodeoxyribonuclease V alpha subunit